MADYPPFLAETDSTAITLLSHFKKMSELLEMGLTSKGLIYWYSSYKMTTIISQNGGLYEQNLSD